MTFDDRLTKADDRDELMGVAINIADELAKEHKPDSICAMCVVETPLAKSTSRDVAKARKVENLVEDVRQKEMKMNGSSFEDTWWIDNEIKSAYNSTFLQELAEPEDCEICVFEPQCGHSRDGRDCPVN